eukprot:CAMPEP_0172585752 /NCGR_PEP_ID=MMETSP1068-20121228/5139_1 /TAXON_ID=35684 /ORGANISM="Pseudopedinella elastica, Strain CCMP716" /LENGTH=197 /DNA_ID=CAMNT_0013380313 /DNA_START=125 /DNA_END=714 /DNA_ORIENTATION=+
MADGSAVGGAPPPPPGASKARRMIYTSAAGEEEEVLLMKDYKDGECSVFIPTLGRERNIETRRLRPVPLSPGDHVVVRGLRHGQAAKLNGRRGVVRAWVAEQGRYSVAVNLGDLGDLGTRKGKGVQKEALVKRHFLEEIDPGNGEAYESAGNDAAAASVSYAAAGRSAPKGPRTAAELAAARAKLTKAAAGGSEVGP